MAPYAIHGLNIRVDGDLPLDLPPGADGAATITVRVQRRPPWAAFDLDSARVAYQVAAGDTESPVQDAGWVAGGAGFRIRFSDGATFWIGSALDEVWFEYSAPLTAADARYYLLEPVLAFVLRRRGVLALHASAVAFDDGAVAFCGPSGTGKSFAAAACVAHGAALLSDDVVALGRVDRIWVAHPGTGSIRLWADGVVAAGLDLAHAPPVSAAWEKRVVIPRSPLNRAARAPARLGAVCLLSGATGPAVRPEVGRTDGMEALRALIPNTAAAYLHDSETRALELAQLAELASAVPVVRLAIASGADQFASTSAAVQAIIRG